MIPLLALQYPQALGAKENNGGKPKMYSQMKWATVSIGALAAAFAAGAAQAQAPGEAARLDEVVVTAERRTENLQRTATSVSVRSGEDLAKEGKFTLGEIIESVPGISGLGSTGASGGGTDSPATGITIRGVGANGVPPNNTASVVAGAALYVDGVSSGVGGSYDIDRVEILRGPQGTLYGRSATAGLIAIHTRDPVIGDGFAGDLTAELGTFNLRHIAGGLNIPVNDKLALRVAGNIYQRDGYDAKKGGNYTTAGNSINTKEARVKVLWRPTEALSVGAGFAYQHNITHTGETIGTLTGTQEVTYVSGQPLGTGRDTTKQYWLDLSWDLGWGTLAYQPTLRTWEQSGTIIIGTGFLAFRQPQATPHDHFITHELRLSSNGDGALQWQTGLFYYNNDLKNSTAQYSRSTNAVNFASEVQKETENVGVFGEATYAFNDALRLTAGVRYDTTEVTLAQKYTSRTGAVLFLQGEAGQRDFTNTTYKLRLEKDLSPNNLLYASISTGFLPGDVSANQDPAGNPVALTLDTETLTSYEIGSKNRFFDETLQVNASAYYSDYGSYQFANVNIGAGPVQAYTNLSTPARIWGGELELDWHPTEADAISLDVAYTRSKFVDQPALFRQYVYQDEAPNLPRWQATAGYNHTFALGGDQSLRLGGEIVYKSSYDYQTMLPARAVAGGLPYVHIKDLTVANLQATWEFRKNTSLTAYVRNVADTRQKNVAVVVVYPSILGFAEKSTPRTAGLTLNYSF